MLHYSRMLVLHLLLEAMYILCPALMLGRAIVIKWQSGRTLPLRKFRLTSLAGVATGVLVCVAFAISVHGRLQLSQVLLAGYFATSLMFVLQGLDRFCWYLFKSMFRLRPIPLPSFWYNFRAGSAVICRGLVICCVGIPYVLATMMTYRPRAASLDDPQTLYHWKFEHVGFAATDGTRIAGWWIPSPYGESPATVLLCPGADKAAQLSLVKRLVPAGYNVLVFDFRATGDSAGQLCSFGDLERRDVLGAVRWLRSNHRAACRKVAGIGVSTGGAALLAAAADASPEGQNIDAVAVYETYDRLDHVVDELSDQFVPAPLSWFVRHLGLPLAGVQVGSNLQAFSPAEQIKAVWPRPVLIIHGIDDELVPFERGQSLFDAALEPKQNFWIKRSNFDGSIQSDAASKLVKEYFDNARRMI